MGTTESPSVTRVLVVDDNVVVRRLMGARLRAGGFEVVEVADGVAALEAFEHASFPVVITDVSMPRLDGLELLAALRQRTVPSEVILLTGTRASDAQAAVLALRLGAHDYISKSPEALEAVVLAVERAAEKWRLRAENHRLLYEAQRASLLDALTSVGNRRAFDETIAKEIARARGRGERLALGLFDIDHFKRVNDVHGHRAGDDVLVGFAARLRSLVRSADQVFRYGGEEFAVLLPDATLDEACAAATRVVGGIEVSLLTAGRVGLRVTCSAGVAALRPTDDASGGDLFARADAALYQAKNGGRNRAVAIAEVGAAGLAASRGGASCGATQAFA